jgi:hypothetical protein
MPCLPLSAGGLLRRRPASSCGSRMGMTKPVGTPSCNPSTHHWRAAAEFLAMPLAISDPSMAECSLVRQLKATTRIRGHRSLMGFNPNRANHLTRLSRKVLRRPAPPRNRDDFRWIRQARFPRGSRPNPEHPDLLTDFRFFAVVKTWMDEDIIEATVRNAFAQGVDSVFVVDNASTDSTLDRAVAAGALVAEVFDHDRFDGSLIQILVNAVAIRESLRFRTPHVWCMYLDSDEFPSGPQGLTVREYLASLDRSFRIVGATFMNHLPHTKPEYIPGFHPIDFQPYCYRFLPQWECDCGHWKHPIQRFDRDRSVIVCGDGAHLAGGGNRGERWEPEEGVVVHHFQYREEERTKQKLALVYETRTHSLPRNQIGDFHRRLESVDAVYKQQWTEIDDNSATAIDTDTLTPWGDLDLVRRWYSRNELESVIGSSAEADSTQT